MKLILVGLAFVFALGCQNVPTVKKSGEVKDVTSGDKLKSDLAVKPGDEVHWTPTSE